MATFKDVIEQVKLIMKNEASPIFGFGYTNIQSHYVWIHDPTKIIGQEQVHYELLNGYGNGPGVTLNVDFEKQISGRPSYFFFKKGITILPPDIRWVKRGNIERLRYTTDFYISDDNVVKKLVEALKYVDDHVGDQIRNLLRPVSKIKTEQIRETTMNQMPLNQILYGPPGTGKTYNTIDKALQIVDAYFYDENRLERGKLNKRFQELLFDYEKLTGQIGFVTFHQSMSYEDFIEGIKPLPPENGKENESVSYDVIPGIFRQICTLAHSRPGNFTERIEWLKQEASLQSGKPKITIKTKWTTFDVAYNGGITFRVWPLAGKAPEAGYPVNIDKIRYLYEGGDKTKAYNYSYVLGILEYLYSNGLVKNSDIRELPDKPYVLIIDEINRGNISQIFGELITLIEDDKRLGNSEQLTTILPYSKEQFGVPKNLHIIGTMNTADRSIEALDSALRRRFTFVEMAPKPELLSPAYMFWRFLWRYEHKGWDDEPYKSEEESLLKMLGASERVWNERKGNWETMEKQRPDEHQAKLFPTSEFNGLNIEQLLRTINRRVEKLLSKDHTIGHAYFVGVVSLADLKATFQHKIIPLLQEYFYGDYGKIGMVLGEGFFEPEEKDENIFADFERYDASGLAERPVYKFIAATDLDDSQFREALNRLLRQTTE